MLGMRFPFLVLKILAGKCLVGKCIKQELMAAEERYKVGSEIKYEKRIKGDIYLHES